MIRDRFADQNVLILVDSQSEEVVLSSLSPQFFILPSDYDYEEYLANPNQADYILIASPERDVIEYHALTDRYPYLFSSGMPGFVLDTQIEEFRLYRNASLSQNQ